METIYGEGWEKNQQVQKLGERTEIDTQLRKRIGPQWYLQFGVAKEDEFWSLAGQRIIDGELTDDFSFGPDWLSLPTGLSLHKRSHLLVILTQCDHIISLVSASDLKESKKSLIKCPGSRSDLSGSHLPHPFP